MLSCQRTESRAAGQGLMQLLGGERRCSEPTPKSRRLHRAALALGASRQRVPLLLMPRYRARSCQSGPSIEFILTSPARLLRLDKAFAGTGRIFRARGGLLAECRFGVGFSACGLDGCRFAARFGVGPTVKGGGDGPGGRTAPVQRAASAGCGRGGGSTGAAWGADAGVGAAGGEAGLRGWFTFLGAVGSGCAEGCKKPKLTEAAASANVRSCDCSHLWLSLTGAKNGPIANDLCFLFNNCR
jgi:hypothetical protein